MSVYVSTTLSARGLFIWTSTARGIQSAVSRLILRCVSTIIIKVEPFSVETQLHRLGTPISVHASKPHWSAWRVCHEHQHGKYKLEFH